MRKMLFVGSIILALMAAPLVSNIAAQDAEEWDDASGFAYGQILSVTAEELLVSEYDFDNDEDIQVTYLLNPETKFENITSSAELTSGDEVEINFKEENGGQKIALMISKEDAMMESDEAAE